MPTKKRRGRVRFHLHRRGGRSRKNRLVRIGNEVGSYPEGGGTSYKWANGDVPLDDWTDYNGHFL